MTVRWRHVMISLFVIGWLGVFHYESIRYYYLNPWFKKQLPKIQWLYPPAGWIMFFHIDKSYGFAQVYAQTGNQIRLIEPHEIFRTRAIMYDNIRRNALISILSPALQQKTCDYLKWRFEGVERFLVTYNQIPDVTQKPLVKLEALAYECR